VFSGHGTFYGGATDRELTGRCASVRQESAALWRNHFAMTTTSPALTARGLTVRYGRTTVVDRVDLSADPGQILGLLGPNGAGKTSVIRALTTIVPVAAGTAVVAGHPLTDATAVRSGIGVLPESAGFPGAQTAISYLRFHGQLFGLGRAGAERRGRRLLEEVGLADNRAPIATFSRGMRQRLGLARAMINDPAVLFLDEPTLGLDPAGKEDLLARLTTTAVEQGTCVILSSHLLDEVERVCDRAVVMDSGRVVADGTVEDIVSASGVAERGRLRVQTGDLPGADRVLRSQPAVRAISFDNTRPGDIELDLVTGPGCVTTILRALLDADIEPRSFDLRGARLSEAFLALTGGRGPIHEQEVSVS
jgi:ABC-2 type transport system ATP-binding protein